MNVVFRGLSRKEIEDLMSRTKDFGEKRLITGDDYTGLRELSNKLDLVLVNCCTHRNRVASQQPGSPIICEDCKAITGHVP